jgi:F-type H+-transporting ATPase subunit epsilon
MKINVELVTPEELVFSQDVDTVVIPGTEGDFGVLRDHTLLMSSIRPGVVSLENNGTVQKIFVVGGFVDVTADRCTILATHSEDVSNLSPEEIQNKINAQTTEINSH